MIRFGNIELTIAQLEDLLDLNRAEPKLSQQVADAMEKLKNGEIDHIYFHITRGD